MMHLLSMNYTAKYLTVERKKNYTAKNDQQTQHEKEKKKKKKKHKKTSNRYANCNASLTAKILAQNKIIL